MNALFADYGLTKRANKNIIHLSAERNNLYFPYAHCF